MGQKRRWEMNGINIGRRDIDQRPSRALNPTTDSTFHVDLLTSLESILTIQTEWEELYNNNNELSPFQAFDWNKAIIENEAYDGRLNCYCFYKRDKIITIAPLVRQNRVVYNELRFLGAETHADYLNFIYAKDLQYEDFYCFIKALINGDHNVILRLDLLHNSSKIGGFINRLPFRQINYCITCVKIPICDSIDQYRAILSKRVKSKIRRCMLRLEQSSLVVDYRFMDTPILKETEVEELLQLYNQRRLEQSQTINQESLNALKQYLTGNQKIFLAECYIERKLAAFFLGLISPSGNICAPITAHDSTYKEYSVGYLLLYNTICFLIRQNKKVEYFDLTRGTEEYKYKFGGIEHLCQNYIVSKRKLAACLYLYVPYFSAKCSLKLKTEAAWLRSCLLRDKR
jgi:CelD/BcsL family acetyltransferase involved in cellulose biosynthesis